MATRVSWGVQLRTICFFTWLRRRSRSAPVRQGRFAKEAKYRTIAGKRNIAAFAHAPSLTAHAPVRYANCGGRSMFDRLRFAGLFRRRSIRLLSAALTYALFGGAFPAFAIPIEITSGYLLVTGLPGVPVYSL